MNPYNEPLDSLNECECAECKNIWWVPFYDEFPMMGAPSYCCFCGARFDAVITEMR